MKVVVVEAGLGVFGVGMPAPDVVIVVNGAIDEGAISKSPFSAAFFLVVYASWMFIDIMRSRHVI